MTCGLCADLIFDAMSCGAAAEFANTSTPCALFQVPVFRDVDQFTSEEPSKDSFASVKASWTSQERLSKVPQFRRWLLFSGLERTQKVHKISVGGHGKIAQDFKNQSVQQAHLFQRHFQETI
jgi:hypothetical protein